MDDGDLGFISSLDLLMWLVSWQRGVFFERCEMCDLCILERWKVTTRFVFLFGEMNCRWLIVFWTFISWKSFWFLLWNVWWIGSYFWERSKEVADCFCEAKLLYRNDFLMYLLKSGELTYPTWGKGKSSSNMPYQADMLISWRVKSGRFNIWFIVWLKYFFMYS